MASPRYRSPGTRQEIPPPEPRPPRPPAVRNRKPDEWPLPDDWPRNEMGYYEPWNNPRMEELQDAAKDWDNRPTREERWEEMNRTPLSREALLSGSVSPSQRYAFRQAEMRAAQREIRSGRNYVDIYLEHRQRQEPTWGDDQEMPWYTDMPDSWFDDRTPGLPLTERTWDPKEPAALPPETGGDGYLEDPSTFQGPRTWKGPREELFFQYEWREDFFFGYRFGKQRYIARDDEQEEQDVEFRDTYQAYF